MNEPLIRMIGELSQTGRQTAREMYGARGWVLHHNTDIGELTVRLTEHFGVCGQWAEPGFPSIYLINTCLTEIKSIWNRYTGNQRSFPVFS
jgi:hypothetical protein